MRTLISIAAFFPLLAMAQGGGGGRALLPWWDQPLTQDLNLSEAQRSQIRAVVKEYRNRLVDERAAVQKAEGELEDVFGDDSVDQRRAAEAIDRLTAARGELTKSLAQMSLRMRSVLTADQWQDLSRRVGRGPRGASKGTRRRVPPSPAGSAPQQGSAPPGSAPPPPPPVKQF